MNRRMLSLAVALGILATSLIYSTLAANSCEECEELCNTIPMDPEDCLQMYCPECAGASSPMG